MVRPTPHLKHLNHMPQLVIKWGPRIVWPIVYLIIVVLSVFSLLRIADMMGVLPPPSEAQFGPPVEFNTRYLDQVELSVIHMATGLAFILLAPLQFSKSFRSKHLVIHRWTGRVLVCCAIISAITGIMAAHLLPAFGGFSSTVASWLLGILMIISVVRAVWCARSRLYVQHREWMIRAFAIGLSVGTQRILIFIFMPMQVASFQDIFAPTLWLGAALNLIVAECWINLTRKPIR